MDFAAELARFAATGRLGVFGYGVHLYDVVAVHGEPQAQQRVSPGRRWPHWLHYGSLQIVWCRCRRLSAMHVPAWHGELEIPGPAAGGSTLVPMPVTESRLTAALTAAGVSWRTEDRPQDRPEQRILTTRPTPYSAVTFTFVARHRPDDAPADDWPLYQASTSGRDHEVCPEPDRAVPDDGYGV
ncbi:hypothetical protein [Streptomyces antimicrobicus]|uniref:Uncharacterized protein n=1 Tax=Streptomyces antimicrobicus TaxID=2883108 RepID=A0ABS8B766_9ACTN|nr:hypothetical protein [Streptomyces antimicrobicus]MCB5180445.1 hypothetical protein [Streptomyces antimicrobicus]